MSDNTCTKRGFKSRKAAHQAVRGMGNSVRVYVCDSCGLFHNTKERYGGHIGPYDKKPWK